MILLLLLTTTTSVSAQQVTERQVEEVSQSQQVLDRAQALKTLYERNEFRALEFNLSQLPPLAQEAVRENLVHYAAEFGKLDQAKATWLAEQAGRKPEFSIVEQGDGYQVTKAAFHYGAKARTLIQHWEHELQADDMMRKAESGTLQLSKWLTLNQTTQKQRRDLFLERVKDLSPQAIDKLVAQFATDSQLLWLPDNAIIASLAAHSGDDEMYQLLWRRRSDHYSYQELNRLASLAPQPDALTQLMAATMNPSLKQQAFKTLIALKPMPASTRQFLIAKMGENDDGVVVAQQLAQQGYSSWLRQLASSHSSNVLKKNLQIVLEQ
ncbi:hypothetical protein A3K86_08250 [Photobacterium jeanii]|uniref:Uncharacterized protein n=1 Tax=Photobacterium jeanii TaxID=858640 RepID=A0A178KK26_9GAMM|nr:hypothetical protein [Photobacterium jeanii]OAN16922.1 hypothetical protein A3K86_08250 [Photobacterium jeanii]PST88212.1 hypothetical protein C9I91_16555 [Photobacterium jeanii]